MSRIEAVKVSQTSKVTGTINLPGDKSISHRAAMFAAIADGTSRISNFASSADCASTVACLQALGVRIDRDGGDVIVHGVGKTGLKEPPAPLDCGNSGTTMRLISGILAGQPFESTLIGDESLSGRPMKRIIGPLTEMGASISATDGHAPLTISGVNPLKPLNFRLPVASAQLKSCVLLAGLNADGETSVTEPVATRDHTERMLRGFGVDVREAIGDGKTVTVSGDARLTATDIQVPSDVSSAAFFLVAASCLAGSRIAMPGVGLNPTRTGIIEVLRRFGATIETADEIVSGGEPIGTLIVSGGGRLGVENNRVDGAIVANLIDEVPILAVFGTQTETGIEIRDAGELRIKESDRVAAVAENLRRMGADVEEFEDGLRVGPSRLKGAVIDTFHDHRIAMAFAIAGLFADGETEIRGAECAAVSFPEFFDVLSSVSNG
ncbi:MAG: 3-phosphoshikimate 1-carboxyvinyltransferase [Pyrinomonadaceae bacterium]